MKAATKTSDVEAIRALMDEWRRRSEEGDLEGVLELMTEDAVFLTPGNPPMSRADFAAGFRLWAEKSRLETTADVREVRVEGDAAHAWSHLTVVMTEKATNRKTEKAGYVLSVFRRSASGDWLLARDANLLMPS